MGARKVPIRLSFVVLTWNRQVFLEKCLDGLIRCLAAPDECEVVVMDNGSTDATPEILKRYERTSMVRVIRSSRNQGVNGYKKLFREARGEYVVVIDDDVLSFPQELDKIFARYMEAYPDYGYLACNVIQNEFTNGAKPGPESYVQDQRADCIVERGPAGGWCSCFRMRDYKAIRFRMRFARLSMKNGDDGFITRAFQEKLGLKSGIIRDAVCFHASGPHYAKEYGHLDREIEKYRQAGLDRFVEEYRRYRD